jgi:hypothetical protein
MYSEKLLLNAIISLENIFEEFSSFTDSAFKRDAFISAISQCDNITDALERNDILVAKISWRVLMRFTDEPIGLGEVFL